MESHLSSDLNVFPKCLKEWMQWVPGAFQRGFSPSARTNSGRGDRQRPPLTHPPQSVSSATLRPALWMGRDGGYKDDRTQKLRGASVTRFSNLSELLESRGIRGSGGVGWLSSLTSFVCESCSCFCVWLFQLLWLQNRSSQNQPHSRTMGSSAGRRTSDRAQSARLVYSARPSTFSGLAVGPARQLRHWLLPAGSPPGLGFLMIWRLGFKTECAEGAGEQRRSWAPFTA